jgi:hypothetical protein
MENKKIPRVIRKTDNVNRRQHFNDKILIVSDEIAAKRLNICKSCSSFNDYGCEVTGFFMPMVTKHKAQQCPYGKWTSDFSIVKDAK